MIQINTPLDVIEKLLGEQNFDLRKKYRLLTYVYPQEINDGLAIYNLLTRELIFLNAEEKKAFDNLDFSNEIIISLVEHWFFVPIGYDDCKLFKQVNKIVEIVNNGDVNQPMKTFVIYPTTDCNARCFYCFELACNRINMTKQTALDVVDFIAKKSKGIDEVNLSWFGGEPLYNYEVIDTICQGLLERKIAFKSAMVSNGYLFDPELVEKAITLWNLKRIQITIDGTEEIYNMTKAYIYKNVSSPFKRVLNNIECLLRSKINVNIRINLDEHNWDDVKVLVSQLLKKFEKYDNFHIYVALLYEECSNRKTPRKQEERWELYKRYFDIEDFLKEKKCLGRQKVEFYRTSQRCMADNNKSTTILPDGKLGKCEHYTDSHFYGSIYSDAIDQKVIDSFKEKVLCDEKCYSCALAPSCLAIKECPGTKTRCDKYDKMMKERTLKNSIITTCDLYFSEKQNNSELQSKSSCN